MKRVIESILDTELRNYRRTCPPNITDLVFLEIEKSYMKDYQDACSLKDAASVNKMIGKIIKDHWSLQNTGRCNSPVSKLISSYEKHSN